MINGCREDNPISELFEAPIYHLQDCTEYYIMPYGLNEREAPVANRIPVNIKDNEIMCLNTS